MMRNCYLSVNWVIFTITILWFSSKSSVNCACINRSEPLIPDKSGIVGVVVGGGGSRSVNIDNNQNVVNNKVNLKSANSSDLLPIPQRHRQTSDFNFSDDEEEEDDTVTGYEHYSDQEGSGDLDGSGSAVDSVGSGTNSNFDHTSPVDRNKLQIPLDVDNALNKDSMSGKGSNSNSRSSSSSSSSPSLSSSFTSSPLLWLISGINLLILSSHTFSCFVNLK